MCSWSSTLSKFDELSRCVKVLTDDTGTEEFVKVLQQHEKKAFQEGISSAREAKHLQKELDASRQSMADLEMKLFTARRLLDMEIKARKEAERDRDEIQRKLLQQEKNLKSETRDKLGFLHTLPKKSFSRKIDGNDINSTRSFLSDLSLTESESSFLEDRSWHEHRHTAANKAEISGSKRRRLCDLNANTPTKAQQPVRRSARRSETSVFKSPLKQNFSNIINTAVVDSPMPQHIKTGGTLMRQHNFVNKTYFMGETCVQCHKKIRFGSVGLRCRDCPIRCHVDCRIAVTLACVPASGTPTIKGMMGRIADYAPSSSLIAQHKANTQQSGGSTLTGTPSSHSNTNSIYSLCATPFKSRLKKRKLFDSPPYQRDE